MRATLWENVSTLKPYNWPSSDMPSSRPPAVDIDVSPCAPNEKVGRLIWGELTVPKNNKGKEKKDITLKILPKGTFQGKSFLCLKTVSLTHFWVRTTTKDFSHLKNLKLIFTVLVLHFSLPYSLCKSIGSLWNIQSRSTRYHAVLFIIKRTWRWLTLRHKI